jgi:hypothetical protein
MSSKYLSVAPVSDSGICTSRKCLRLSKSVSLDDIGGLVIKSCSEILYLFLNIFPTSLSQQVTIHICNKVSNASVNI